MPDSHLLFKHFYDHKWGWYFRFSRFQNEFNLMGLMFSCSRHAQVTFVEKPQWKISSFQNYKHQYLIILYQNKLLQMPMKRENERTRIFSLFTVVNQVLFYNKEPRFPFNQAVCKPIEIYIKYFNPIPTEGARCDPPSCHFVLR